MLITYTRYNLDEKKEITYKELSLKDLRSKLVYESIVTDTTISFEQYGSLIEYKEYFTGCYHIKYKDTILISEIELETDDEELAKALSYIYYRITNNTQRSLKKMEALQKNWG